MGGGGAGRSWVGARAIQGVPLHGNGWALEAV